MFVVIKLVELRWHILHSSNKNKKGKNNHDIISNVSFINLRRDFNVFSKRSLTKSRRKFDVSKIKYAKLGRGTDVSYATKVVATKQKHSVDKNSHYCPLNQIKQYKTSSKHIAK